MIKAMILAAAALTMGTNTADAQKINGTCSAMRRNPTYMDLL